MLLLKKSTYPLLAFKLAGDDQLIDAYMRNERGQSVQMNISQRLKLDQPRTGEILRVSASQMEHSTYMLAVADPNKANDIQAKPLSLLVNYFKVILSLNFLILHFTSVDYCYIQCTASLLYQ